jgi:hypothetical protein
MVDRPSDFIGRTPQDLVFDDDPIETVLYGSSPQAPTDVSIFAPARRLLEEIQRGQHAPDMQALLEQCDRFLADEHPLTPELVAGICELVVPLAVFGALNATDERRGLLGRLLKSLWRYEATSQPRPATMLAGWGYWIWCHRRRDMGEAEGVLAGLYERAGSNRDEITEAANLLAKRFEDEGDVEAAEQVYSQVRDVEGRFHGAR